MRVLVTGASGGLAPFVIRTLWERHEVVLLSRRHPQAEFATLPWIQGDITVGADGVRQQLAIYHVYHNFVLPHSSLRQPLAEPLPPNGSGSVKLWRPCTPAMAAGLTDHVWSLREVLLYRVPPWSQPHAL
jgi:hypothetical protein